MADSDKIWTKQDAAVELMNRVYAACSLLETLEVQRTLGHGGIIGNGHHAMQAVAEAAKEELLRRWENPKT